MTAERCPILHIDMDAFYASVMTRDRPDLEGVPVVVGGGERGVVLSANYLARRSGIRSALSMTRARRMCPEAMVIAPDFDLLSSVSSAVMETFRRVTPMVEALSMDEAFLDVSGATRRLGSAVEIAEQVRAIIRDEQGIACSVGVAASASLAKIASRRAKPDGVLRVAPDQVTGFLHPLPVEELWGVGEKTQATLNRLGVFTVGDLAHTPRPILQRALGPAQAGQLHDLAWGVDRRAILSRPRFDEPDKSIGAEETFSRDVDDRAVVVREFLRLSAKVTGRMRRAGLAGRTVTIRVRFSDFSTVTRSKTMGEATDVTQEVYRSAVRLYDAMGLQRARLRLVGVRVEGLLPRSSVQHQLVLGERDRGWAEADRAMDRAVVRFGPAAVRPASLLAHRDAG